MSDIDLNSPEVKKAIEAAVEAAVKPLADKRDELLGEVKKLRKESAIKPEDLEAVEKERDELRGQLNAANKLAKDSKEAADKAAKQLEAESGFTQKLVLENQLVAKFMEAGVKDPDFLDLLKSKHLPLGKVVIDGENRKAMFGDKDIDAYVKEWQATEPAKKMIAAPNNSGGGAGGGNANPDPNKPMTSTQKIAAGLKKL
jgi:alanyl-tRNA synthetase